MALARSRIFRNIPGARPGDAREPATAGTGVAALDLIETPVSNGIGTGLSVAVPRTGISRRIRVLKRDDFAPVVVGVFATRPRDSQDRSFAGGVSAASTAVANLTWLGFVE